MGSDPQADLRSLVDLTRRGGVVVLSGAGISTDSGIPDYRGPTGLARGAVPMTYQELIASEPAQQRYWARSFAGWPLIRSARPNPAHLAVAQLQTAGLVDAVVTQNVDGLHQAAGSDPVVELHGTLDQVVCLTCQARHRRDAVQDWLAAANPSFDPSALEATFDATFEATRSDRPQVRPDGDVVLREEAVRAFRTVPCPSCAGGPLKPDVVFFGESVPKERVGHCYRLVDAARALLVLGSSLTVMSGYRFVRHARRNATPVVIVNQGPTRGDGDATLRIDQPLGVILPAVAAVAAAAGVAAVTPVAAVTAVTCSESARQA